MKDVFLVNYSVKGIKALDKLSERNQTYFTMPSQKVILATLHQIVYHKSVMLKVDNEIMNQFKLPSEDILWGWIVENRGRLFKTYSGLPFSYDIKTGRDGNYTKELWIDRRQHIKSLAWGSIRRAYEKAAEQ